ncbi:MAG: pantoate--beta-alanine ligase [Wenzhouxiangellaceae bacterium]|nr:pantoate--beta-alanine ligase [Wenzhouxiangellaceae bacterium]
MTGPRVIESPSELAAWRDSLNRPLHLVPTMGNLHAGHLALVEHARAGGAAVAVSIFVNPTQFGPNEDFERYPRTLDADCAALAESGGCDIVWLPSVATMYPLPESQRFSITPPPALADTLCGRARPGHFDGVCSVVMRLFWQLRPRRAFFGEKDYQQLLILRRMAEDFSLPLSLEAVATVREPDGLAMSSRNAYLDAEQRRRAPALYRTLCQLAEEAVDVSDAGTFAELERSGWMTLEAAGFVPDYVVIRDAGSLGPPGAGPLRLLAAAQLGPARLIDNVAITRQNPK